MKITDCTDCDTGICPPHHAALAKALGNGPDSIPAHYVELNIGLVPGQGGSDDPIVTTSKTRRLPIAAGPRDAQERILTTTQAIEAWARAGLGWTPAPRRGREGPTLQCACTTLSFALEQWTRLPEAREQAGRLLALTGTARSALGIAGPRHNRIDLPCPHCHTRTLRRVNGRDDIACMYCAAVVELAWLELQLDITPDRKAA